MRSLILFLVLLPMLSFGQYFEFSPELRSAYDDIIALKLDSGQAKINELKTTQPDNMLVYYVEDYIDFFTIFVGEKRTDFDRLIANKDRRMKKVRSGDKLSPYYRFCQAEIHLHWATARMKFDQKFEAAREIYAAYNLLTKNQKKHPYFISNKKSLSIIHSVAESIPKWIQRITGIKGSVALGVKEISDLVEYAKKNDYPFAQEAYGIYAYIQFYQNNQREKGYQELANSGLNPAENPLVCFLLAQLAHKTNRPDEAMDYLHFRPQGTGYYPFHYLQFMLGNYQLEQLNPEAVANIQAFVNQFEGQHFIKEAYQKLGWAALVFDDDFASYKKYMSLVQKKGKKLIDEDKQAYKEADSKVIPNRLLLKARLLFDGSQYERARDLMITHAYEFPEGDDDFLEYNYRLGRVLQELKNYNESLIYFQLAIKKGGKRSFYACNSALQSGIIYEQMGDWESARQYFKKCLKIKSDKYKSSLHQKAKSGLSRIKNR